MVNKCSQDSKLQSMTFQQCQMSRQPSCRGQSAKLAGSLAASSEQLLKSVAFHSRLPLSERVLSFMHAMGRASVYLFVCALAKCWRLATASSTCCGINKVVDQPLLQLQLLFLFLLLLLLYFLLLLCVGSLALIEIFYCQLQNCRPSLWGTLIFIRGCKGQLHQKIVAADSADKYEQNTGGQCVNALNWNRLEEPSISFAEVIKWLVWPQAEMRSTQSHGLALSFYPVSLVSLSLALSHSVSLSLFLCLSVLNSSYLLRFRES